ncbi:hypothetical protein GLOTRDRAFT_125106 [Gloeophyllum trabeum ATCC 11539]|uniref:F-box domain-containing protein n=1 Tax=Gloeophyllum trabeum (strain ATCC 11539 / FP-39264 / Madison 617) TaxID=670483 RepID=S7QHV8_GLOTA|nr:uncharacterized protein GLOTRDRAFT_125106 [Gloeophyllum trabeum ATCC 11539]EPQ58777.1 hypothetical protein GLOTRDRAFT_125106 [Gloeophyllum trabeum ATCC 11539]
MDALPAELIHQILELLCTDASDPFRFRAVAVTTPGQLVSLLDAFTQSSPLAKASMRHLFMVVHKESTEAGSYILQRTSHTLETLTCLIEDSGASVDQTIIWTTFPRLTALTLRYRIYPYYFFIFGGPPESIPTLPNLRYLHVAQERLENIHAVHRTMDLFARRTGGRLERARVSSVIVGEASIRSLQEILSFGTVGGAPPVPASLRYYVIELDSVARWWSQPESQVTDRLVDLKRWAEEQGVVQLIILPSSRTYEKTPEMWKEEWLQVQSGAVDRVAEWLDTMHGTASVASPDSSGGVQVLE